MKVSDKKFYLQELQSNECLCGDYKNPGKSFCYWCYGRLPKAMKNALYQQIGNGYEEALDEAVKYLGLNEVGASFSS
jgi:hypothetical protein